MKKILNVLFLILKYLLFLAAFGFTLFILIQINHRLGKNITTVLPVFIPYALLLILFVLNLLRKQTGVMENLFYNVTSCLVFAVIIFVGYRSFADKNMVLNDKYGYGIDFNYFNNFVAYMKIMLYGLSIANVFFMFHKKKEN